MPRYVRERRGIVYVTSDGFERHMRPRGADRVFVDRLAIHDASALAHAGFPKPGRIVSDAKRARARPSEVVERRALVIDPRSADRAERKVAKQAGREPKANRKGDRKEITVQRGQAAETVVARPRREGRGGKMHADTKAGGGSYPDASGGGDKAHPRDASRSAPKGKGPKKQGSKGSGPGHSARHTNRSGLLRTRRTLLQEQLMATLSGYFGVLATVGLYGVPSYMVARRRHEIGIRMALGAKRRDIALMVLGEVATLVTAGLVAGAVAAFVAAKATSALLFGVTPNDPVTLAAAAGIRAAVAAAAGLLPADRASSVDPMTAVRDE
jgi:hypothetical protein